MLYSSLVKIYSWNVNGIRAVIRKELFQPFVDQEKPDIICLQEIKARPDQFDLPLDGYSAIYYPAVKPGYSGTAILTKLKPLQSINGFPKDIIKKYKVEGDTYGNPNDEGRIIAAEYDDFWLVTCYTPNAKDDLSRLPVREKWDAATTAYCKQLESGKAPVDHGLDGAQGGGEQQTEPYKKYGEGVAQPTTQRSAKPVIYCGDMNVAHTEDDLANPKPNIGKKGFTEEERSGFDNWLAAGFIDTFRLFKQGNGYYTWWSHFANARARNVGWRIDYFLASESLRRKIKAAEIHPKILGSDHCPISLTIKL